MEPRSAQRCCILDASCSPGGNGRTPNPPCREIPPHLRLPNQSARSEAPAKRHLSAHACEVNAGDHVVVWVLVVALLQEDEARLVRLHTGVDHASGRVLFAHLCVPTLHRLHASRVLLRVREQPAHVALAQVRQRRVPYGSKHRQGPRDAHPRLTLRRSRPGCHSARRSRPAPRRRPALRRRPCRPCRQTCRQTSMAARRPRRH
mmetsp:Transcript_25578/g.86217  ORF Transcript_25578/g.86217 Transcript_25578/m.86217 type:complete len:204 (+) Transcript_25578:79-690(+)